ncbi:MAG: histidinol dehydrogenase [Candidatus Margulisiibacteriota bacterium]
MNKEEAIVKRIIADVRKTGDAAIIKYAEKFENIKISAQELRVAPQEIEEAFSFVGSEFVSTIRLAARNIRAYHEKQKQSEWFDTLPDDVVLGFRIIPIESVGLYVPSGRAVYPSSVLMNAIPAKIAGVKRIVIAVPCGKNKKVNPYILAAAKEAGISEIYKMGGAQAVAALAIGTRTIKKVDKIVGPGNIYVTLAKKMLFGEVGIDKLAGPSDVVIIADESADIRFISSDMAAQAEHDPNSKAVLISTSDDILRDAKAQMKKLKKSGQCKFYKANDLDEAARLSNEIAPEHLELLVSVPHALLGKITNAGAVFMGPYSPVAVGDYLAGPNHVLPTDGTARFSSPLGVWDFVKYQSVIGYTKPALSRVRKDLIRFSSIEGLKAHGESVNIRFKEF